MSAAAKACPTCGSLDVRFREKRSEWICDDCDARWTEGGTGASPAGRETPKARLFLSYGRADAQELAERLDQDLTANGYAVWRNTRKIRAGDTWEDEILDGLRNTQLLSSSGSGPFRARSDRLETMFESIRCNRPIAWFPTPIYELTLSPDGRTWAGRQLNRFYLLRLEGPDDQPS